MDDESKDITNLDELFEEPKPDTVEDTGETETAEQAEPETETPKEEPESAPPADEESKEIVGIKAALNAERKKRQELEEKLRAQQEPEKIPDPVEDPEGYAAHLEFKQVAASYQLRAEISRSFMAEMKPDYAEKEAVFLELANTRPDLIAKIQSHPNPAKFAYDTAAEHLEIQKLRDPKHIESLVAEKAKALMEQMLKDQKTDKPVTALDVPDPSKAAAAGANTVHVEKETTLDELFEGAAF